MASDVTIKSCNRLLLLMPTSSVMPGGAGFCLSQRCIICPRNSPPGLAAVCRLTYHFPASRSAAWSAVNTALPVNSVAEFIAYAKANPGKVNYGSSGAGSPHHLAGELLRGKTGIDITHVPYKGGGAAANDLLGGHINAAFLSLSAAVPLISSGKIKILAMVEKQRYAEMKDIPTISETVPGFEMNSWLGLFAPAGTPQPIVDRLNAEVGKILKIAAVKDRLATLGLAVAPSTPAELAEIVSSGLALRGQLVKAAGIQPE